MIKNKCKKIVLAMLIMTMIATTFSVDVFAGGDNSDCISDICESCTKGCLKGCLKCCKDIGCCPCIPYPTPIPVPINIDGYDFNENTKELTLLSNYSKVGPIPQYTNEIKTVTINPGVKRLVGTFQNCHKLTTVYTSDTLEEIGENAFADCGYLNFIKIPDSVTKIGAYAFKGCTSLTSITIPDSVTTISEHAFDGYKGNVIKPTKPVPQPEPLKSDVFIDHIIPPAPQPEENKGANCITPPAPQPVYTYNNNRNYQYNNQTNISNIIISTIPSGVTSIADGAFKDRKDLTSITIPDSVTEIGKEAFANCTNLKSVTIGNNVESIGKDAFKGCISLESITIPRSVVKIGDNAFADCTSLNSVINFGRRAFLGDENIFANHCGGFKIQNESKERK